MKVSEILSLKGSTLFTVAPDMMLSIALSRWLTRT
jgi:hypothetical protein